MRFINGSMQRMSRTSIGNPLNIRRKSEPLARERSTLLNEEFGPRRLDKRSSCCERSTFSTKARRKRESYPFRSFHPLAVIGEILRVPKGSKHALIEWLGHLKQCRPVDITSFDSGLRCGQGKIGTVGCRRQTNDLKIEFFTQPGVNWGSSLTLFADGVVRRLLIW